MYKLDSEDSDYDYRGVFMTSDVGYVIGINRFNEDRMMSKTEDSVNRELLHFARLLVRGNTEAMEVLFASEDVFSFQSPIFKVFRDYRYNLIDSVNLYTVLRHYAINEMRMALGERKGKIGNKRADQVIKYGFSPKNFTQLFRLVEMGILFFKNSIFCVDTRGFDIHVYDTLRSIKFSPESHTADELKELASVKIEALDKAYESRERTYVLDKQLLNLLLLRSYFPSLREANEGFTLLPPLTSPTMHTQLKT
jgi:hypothetical protein